MKVTGYELREGIRRHTTRREVASKQFMDSLWSFPGDTKLSTAQIATDFESADTAVAQLESAQQMYNSMVEVKALGTSMTLSEAVKRLGGAGRLEKMWRSAATDTGRDRYHTREASRKADDVFAQRTIAVTDCLSKAEQSAKFASALRAAVAEVNSKSVDVPGLNPALLT